jgi:hypothetical protein
MKILTKTIKNIETDMAEGGAATGNEGTSFEIPNTTIAGLGAILTVILTFANGVSPLLKEWLVGVPNDKVTSEISVDTFKLSLIKQALQNKTPQDRANSLKLLITVGLLKDPNGELIKLTNNPDLLPQWETNISTVSMPTPITSSSPITSPTTSPPASPISTPTR